MNVVCTLKPSFLVPQLQVAKIAPYDSKEEPDIMKNLAFKVNESAFHFSGGPHFCMAH